MKIITNNNILKTLQEYMAKLFTEVADIKFLMSGLEKSTHDDALTINKNIVKVINKKDLTNVELIAINKRLDLLNEKFGATEAKIDEFLANFTVVEHLDIDPRNPQASATPSGGVKEDLLNTVDSEKHYASIAEIGQEALSKRPQVKIEHYGQ